MLLGKWFFKELSSKNILLVVFRVCVYFDDFELCRSVMFLVRCVFLLGSVS